MGVAKYPPAVCAPVSMFCSMDGGGGRGVGEVGLGGGGGGGGRSANQCEGH